MAALLDRRRPPPRLGVDQPARRATPARRASPPAEVSSSSPPIKLVVLSAALPMEITSVEFSCSPTWGASHTDHILASGCAAVLRRGDTLVTKVSLSEGFTAEYNVTLTFVSAFRPRERFGQFQATSSGHGTRELWLSIAVPVNFPVGKYHANISLSLHGGAEAVTHFHPQPIVVLFNPWNPADDTFLDSDEEKQHYLLSEVGTIWRGSCSEQLPMLWEYGQHAEHSLDVALYLLHELSAAECRSAARVGRCLVGQVLSHDGSGVLAGRHTSSYAGGTHPHHWMGSSAILHRFHQSRTPVKFGECWVFAGVAVTLLRALGIPARPVTCYEAARPSTHPRHPRHILRCFSTEGELLDNGTRDQIWLFHVWCEAWMRRDDLPEGYDGWQALDPTLLRAGVTHTGPASVRAVLEERTGGVWGPSTEHFVSAVASELRYVRVPEAPAWHTSVACTQRGQVGVAIVTSAGSTQVDLTRQYLKQPATSAPGVWLRLPPPSQDCRFELQVSEKPALGTPLHVRPTIQNKGPLLRSLDGQLVASCVQHTGTAFRTFLSIRFSGTVSPGQSASVLLPVLPSQWRPGLTDHGLLRLFLAIKVRETGQLWLHTRSLAPRPPALEVLCRSQVEVGGALHVRLRFHNVLPSSLSCVRFLLQGQQLCPLRELSHRRPVPPDTTASVELTVQVGGVRAGHYTLLASLHCDQLRDVRGSTEVLVTSTPALPSP